MDTKRYLFGKDNAQDDVFIFRGSYSDRGGFSLDSVLAYERTLKISGEKISKEVRLIKSAIKFLENIEGGISMIIALAQQEGIKTS